MSCCYYDVRALYENERGTALPAEVEDNKDREEADRKENPTCKAHFFTSP